MSDAGGAESNGYEQDLDFGVDRGFSYGTTFDYGNGYDLDFGRERGITTPSYDLGLVDTSGLRGILTGGGGGGEPESPIPGPELEETKKEVAEEVEKTPTITRGRRRRSLLTEDEGGVLRRPPVYRRSILGR